MNQRNQPFGPDEQPQNHTTDIYSEESLWLCENRKTKFKTRIHGALAQILKKYPADYRLKLLNCPGGHHEHTAPASE